MKHLSHNQCEKCGSILVSRVYSINPNIEPIDMSLIDLVMLCREFGVDEIDEVKKIYRSSYINLFKTHYKPARLSVVSLHIYMLTTNRVSRLNEYCSFMGCRRSSVKKILNKLETVYKVNDNYTLEECKDLLRNIELQMDYKKVESLIELLSVKIEMNTSVLAACIYNAGNLSLRKIAQVFHISRQTVLNYNKKIEEII